MLKVYVFATIINLITLILWSSYDFNGAYQASRTVFGILSGIMFLASLWLSIEYYIYEKEEQQQSQGE